MTIHTNILIIFFLISSQCAHALNKCVEANGNVIYLDKPCGIISPGATGTTPSAAVD